MVIHRCALQWAIVAILSVHAFAANSECRLFLTITTADKKDAGTNSGSIGALIEYRRPNGELAVFSRGNLDNPGVDDQFDRGSEDRFEFNITCAQISSCSVGKVSLKNGEANRWDVAEAKVSLRLPRSVCTLFYDCNLQLESDVPEHSGYRTCTQTSAASSRINN